MTLINLTPHTIVFQAADGALTEFPSEGVARVATIAGARIDTRLELGADCIVPIYAAPTMGEVEGLPSPTTVNVATGTDEVVFIVSLIVLSHPSVAGRSDVVAPGTGPIDGAIRFPKDHPQAGQVEAVTRFIAAPAKPRSEGLLVVSVATESRHYRHTQVYGPFDTEAAAEAFKTSVDSDGDSSLSSQEAIEGTVCVVQKPADTSPMGSDGGAFDQDKEYFAGSRK